MRGETAGRCSRHRSTATQTGRVSARRRRWLPRSDDAYPDLPWRSELAGAPMDHPRIVKIELTPAHVPFRSVVRDAMSASEGGPGDGHRRRGSLAGRGFRDLQAPGGGRVGGAGRGLRVAAGDGGFTRAGHRRDPARPGTLRTRRESLPGGADPAPHGLQRLPQRGGQGTARHGVLRPDGPDHGKAGLPT